MYASMKKVVPGGGPVAVLDQREVLVSVETLLQLHHFFHFQDTRDADMPLLLMVS